MAADRLATFNQSCPQSNNSAFTKYSLTTWGFGEFTNNKWLWPSHVMSDFITTLLVVANRILLFFRTYNLLCVLKKCWFNVDFTRYYWVCGKNILSSSTTDVKRKESLSLFKAN